MRPTPGPRSPPRTSPSSTRTIKTGQLSDLLRDVNSNGAVFNQHISLGEEVPQGRTTPTTCGCAPKRAVAVRVGTRGAADPVLLQWVKSPLDTAAFVDHAIHRRAAGRLRSGHRGQAGQQGRHEQALADAAVSART